jgi:hypothetical protein
MYKHAERHFWSKVHGTDGCWIWTSTIQEKGYGRFWFEGRRMMAHRVAYILTYGRFDPSTQVLHHCDNPPCCHPDHLYLGTNDDNVRDKVAKNRQAKKITPEQATEIRSLYATGEWLQREIAEKFGIKHVEVSRIVNRQRWSHLIEPSNQPADIVPL